MDADGYPDDQELERIANWKVDDVNGLMDFVAELWWHPEMIRRTGSHKEYVELITGGWSGNEDIVRALINNYVFWNLCWEMSRRGGYHLFNLAHSPYFRPAEHVASEP